MKYLVRCMFSHALIYAWYHPVALKLKTWLARVTHLPSWSIPILGNTGVSHYFWVAEDGN